MSENRSASFLSSLLGFIGGVIATLIGAGILFPSNEWSPAVEKTGTAAVTVSLPKASYNREILVQGEFRGNAVGDKAWFRMLIEVNGTQCNKGEEVYTNPTTGSMLSAKDFCSFIVNKNQEAVIRLTAPQDEIDSVSAVLRIQTRRIGRALF